MQLVELELLVLVNHIKVLVAPLLSPGTLMFTLTVENLVPVLAAV